MEVKLFWSFDSRMNLYGATEYMYDLYRASMLRAKNLGYEINFYGDDVAINKFQGYVDHFYDITPIHFEIVDDLKLYIHTQHDLDCVTIDGDLILALENKPNVIIYESMNLNKIMEAKLNLWFVENLYNTIECNGNTIAIKK